MTATRGIARLLFALVLLGCRAELEPRSQAEIESPDRSPKDLAAVTAMVSPTGAGAMAPHMVTADGDVLLTWLEPRDEGGHRFRVTRLEGEQWSLPITIAEGDDFFANWADVPKVGVAGDGTLWAHWLAKIGEDTYAYGIFLSRSDDGGRSWRPMGMLHDDDSPTEHGFVAYAPAGEDLRALWLDGRAMATGGAMAVRTALLTDAVGRSTVVDDRVCECCPTALVSGPAGAVAFFRDRSPAEVRNIALSRELDDEWSASRPLWNDDWMIPGCPVNGPAAVTDGSKVAVAWFTAADNEPLVKIAFSSDGGATFAEPLVVVEDKPLGRVALETGTAGDVWLSWLAVVDEVAELRLARFDAGGERERLVVARTGASRASGIPRLVRHGESLLLAWVTTEEDRPAAIRLVRLDLV